MNTQRNQPFLKSIIKTPWATRNYFLAIIVFCYLDYFYSRWSYFHLTSNFFITILNYQVWRALTFIVYEPNLLIAILMLVHLAFYLPKFERQNGTVVTFFQIATIATLIQFFTLCYEALIYLLNDNQITSNWKVMFNIGAGSVFVNMYLKFLWFNFKENNRKFSPRALFTYFYPVFLIIIATLTSQQTRVDMITGYILAFIECAFFRGGMIFFTADTYTEKEKIVRYLRLPRIPLCNYIKVNEQKIKPNHLGVVQANQFYILGSYMSTQSANELHEVEMETERGSFSRSNGMVEDEFSHQGKGEKWEQTQIVDQE